MPSLCGVDISWLEAPDDVVNASLIDEVGQPTATGRDEIFGFFAERWNLRPLRPGRDRGDQGAPSTRGFTITVRRMPPS